MGRFGLDGNFPVKMVHLQRWSSWTVGPVRPKLPFPLPKIFLSSPTLLSSNQNFGRNGNGSFRCDWKRCFNRTMSFHFLLMIPLIMSVKTSESVRILIYRTWAISAQKLLCTNSQTLHTAVSYSLINQSKLSTLKLLKNFNQLKIAHDLILMRFLRILLMR